ncbi:MAG: sigma-70 family RNA polymerase sigma factor [Solirubrobacteraceae bacterium]
MALFRAGSEDAFRAIHDRYRARLHAYSRQMLGGCTFDAEDAMQDVFVRVYAALRANTRPISLRAWLYRIAHNRCVDEIRRPRPMPCEIHAAAELALSRDARHDPPLEAQRSETFACVIADIQALPEQQRSALLMRELQGLTYEELAGALDISVAAVKSLLLRARTGMVDATLAREAPCEEIHADLLAAHERGVRASGPARRHMRECAGCREYRVQLSAVRRNIASLVPSGPLGHLGVLFGLGGGSASASGGLAASAGGGAAAAGGAAATKFAAIVCCAALLGSAGTAFHRDLRPVPGAPTRAAEPAPATSLPAPPQGRPPVHALTNAPAQRSAASNHAVARHAVGRAQKVDVQPLTGQDMLYEALPKAPAGVDSVPTPADGTSAARIAAGTPTATIPVAPPAAAGAPPAAGNPTVAGQPTAPTSVPATPAALPAR